MPTRPAKAKWLLKNGKAKVVRRSPFTIQLTYQIENPQKQPTSLAFDDGEVAVPTQRASSPVVRLAENAVATGVDTPVGTVDEAFSAPPPETKN